MRCDWRVLALAALLTGCSAPASTTAAASRAIAVSPPPPGPSDTSGPRPSPTPPAPHLMVVVLENTEYSSVIGRAAAPTLNALASRYGLATAYFATTHPSLPNYLELLAGTTFGITDDCPTCSVEGRTLVDGLAQAGVAWRAYMEGMPVPCFNGPAGPGAHPYARRHDPFMYVEHLRRAPGCAVVPGEQLRSDLTAGTAPPFLWVSPNLCDDGHDAGCGLAVADTWTAALVGGVQASSWYRDGGTVLIVFDEGTSSSGCCGGARGGHIAAIAVSDRLRGSRLATPLDHAGVLRGISEYYGVAPIGDAADPVHGDIRPLLQG